MRNTSMHKFKIVTSQSYETIFAYLFIYLFIYLFTLYIEAIRVCLFIYFLFFLFFFLTVHIFALTTWH